MGGGGSTFTKFRVIVPNIIDFGSLLAYIQYHLHKVHTRCVISYTALSNKSVRSNSEPNLIHVCQCSGPCDSELELYGIYVRSMFQCLHWRRGQIPTLGASSVAIPFVKRLTVHYLIISDGT